MLLALPQNHQASLGHHGTALAASKTRLGTDATIDAPLQPRGSMERSANDYSQTGLPSPYPSNYGDRNSEAPTADHASAAQATQYPVKQEVNYSASATPTSEYGVYPQSARSASYPDQLHRQYHPTGTTGNGGGMAQQQPNSPSMPQHDERSHQAQADRSNNDVPIDPSIAAPSPTYPYGQHSPYANPDMAHSYPHQGGMYAQPRPDWAGYGQHAAPITPGHPVYPHTPSSAASQPRPSQVYSFVPIPGAQQHKRPRRRYEEIERMYKCGWNGCEKAYGTLNHLNAHVTMQSHGPKRTPEGIFYSAQFSSIWQLFLCPHAFFTLCALLQFVHPAVAAIYGSVAKRLGPPDFPLGLDFFFVVYTQHHGAPR
jgi:hypothetical protein